MGTPKLSLINEQGPCPPNGFRWVDPEDGWVAHAWAYNDWIPLAKSHLSANNRPIPGDLEEQMQNQLCQTLPPGWCNYDSEQRPRPQVDLGWGDVLGGLATFARWIQSGLQYVPQDEADRRALICSRCYLNVHVEGCGACHKAVAEVTKSRKSKYDFALKACAVCKCLLRAKVHFPLDTLNKNNDNLQPMYPSHCWLKEGGDNYRG